MIRQYLVVVTPKEDNKERKETKFQDRLPNKEGFYVSLTIFILSILLLLTLSHTLSIHFLIIAFSFSSSTHKTDLYFYKIYLSQKKKDIFVSVYSKPSIITVYNLVQGPYTRNTHKFSFSSIKAILLFEQQQLLQSMANGELVSKFYRKSKPKYLGFSELQRKKSSIGHTLIYFF